MHNDDEVSKHFLTPHHQLCLIAGQAAMVYQPGFCFSFGFNTSSDCGIG